MLELIAPKFDGNFNVMARYIPNKDLPKDLKLYLTFEKEVEDALGGQQCTDDWLKATHKNIKGPELVYLGCHKGKDEEQTIMPVGTVYWGCHPMDFYRVYISRALDDLIKEPWELYDDDSILKAMSDKKVFKMGAAPIPDEKTLRDPLTSTCVTSSKYCAASTQERERQQNSVMGLSASTVSGDEFSGNRRPLISITRITGCRRGVGWKCGPSGGVCRHS
jgi:hypothetical protein